MDRFGLKSLRELPPLEDFAPDEESKQFIRERLSGRSISSTLEEAAEDLAEEQELLREDYTDDDIDDIGHIDGIDYDAEIFETPRSTSRGARESVSDDSLEDDE